jgi:hypothetical protein
MSRRQPIVDTPESDSDNERASNEMHMESSVREQSSTKDPGFGLDMFLDSALISRRISSIGSSDSEKVMFLR